MKLFQAVEAFLLSKEIEGLSPNTIRNYTLSLKRLQAYVGREKVVADIELQDLRHFLHRLRTQPPSSSNHINQPDKPLSAKTVKNIHSNLSTFFSWAIGENLLDSNPMQRINAPAPRPPAIQPFTRVEVLALLAIARKHNREELRLRDTAMILLLLDTGVRNSELRRLAVRDVDLKMRRAKVRGKGRFDFGQGKERIVFFSARTAKAIHRYLLFRGEVADDNPLFVTFTNRCLKRYHLTQHVSRLGERAGLSECNVHKFRHTFAIEFLRNAGGNIYVLQQLLGHSSLDMVKRYLAIAQSDLERAHQEASPVDRWGL